MQLVLLTLHSIPPGILAVLLLVCFMPRLLPYGHPPVFANLEWSMESFRVFLDRTDFLGFILLLTASCLVVTALLEADAVIAWNSPTTICLLIFGSVALIGFLAYERFLTNQDCAREPVFPWRFLYDRVWMVMLL